MIYLLSTENELLHWAREFCVAGAGLGSLYLLIVAVAVLGFPRPRARRGGAAAVTILKPLHGLEPRLFGRLASFCVQNHHRAPVQLVFGTMDSADASVEVLHQLRAAFPERQIDWKVDPQEHGPNRKVSNLINMMRAASHDVLIVSDSDILVGENYLADVVGELQRPGVGAVTCLYHGVPGGGFWSRLSALAINGQFLPQAAMAQRFGLAKPCFGATIAMPRNTLAAIGGFSAFSDFLAEDYAIGEAIRALGYKVVVPSWSVGHVCLEENFRSFLLRQLRFARTIKSIDPIGYAGSILSYPLPLALLGGVFGYPDWMLYAAIALGCRLAACMAAERVFNLGRQPYWLLPLQDAISFCVYIVSFCGATVAWRGCRYRLRGDGSLVQIEK